MFVPIILNSHDITWCRSVKQSNGSLLLLMVTENWRFSTNKSPYLRNSER